MLQLTTFQLSLKMSTQLKITSQQHAILKRAFLFVPNPDNYPEAFDAIQKDTGLEVTYIRSWFKKMRAKIGVNKSKKEEKNNDSGFAEEKVVPDSVKESGIGPLDYNPTLEEENKDKQMEIVSECTETSFDKSELASSTPDNMSLETSPNKSHKKILCQSIK